MSKKILLNIFVLFLMSFSVVNAAKIDTLRYDGVDHKYTGPEISLILNNEIFEVQENLMPPVVLESRTLVPAREVFETLGGKVEWDGNEKRVDVELGSKTISLWIDNTEAKIDEETITTDVPAKIINSKTMVPARFISEQAGLTVDTDWESEIKKVFINIPVAKITNVEYTKVKETDCLIVSADSPIFEYKYYMAETKDKLILDVKNSKFKIDTSTQELDDDLAARIRFGNHEDENYNRIVLDLNEETDYIVVPSKDRTKLYFAMSSEFEIPGEEQKEDEIIKNPVIEDENPVVDEKEDINSESAPSGDSDIELDNKENENIANSEEKENQDELLPEDNGQNIIVPDVYITSIKYSTISKRIKIAYDGELEYTDATYEDPYRIVVDIKNAELKTEGPKQINLKNSGIISSIRFSQYENSIDGNENLVRVVIDLKAESEYKINKRSSELQVTISQQDYMNVGYQNNETSAQITLYNVRLNDLTKSRNESKNRYIIKYSSKDFESGHGEINPDDEFVESITVTDSKITIYDAGNMVYTMKQSGDNVIVTIKEKEEIKDKKIILIDVGHGGEDPGSNRDKGKIKESDFNLSIATMLYDMLSEHKEIKAYMTRYTDESVTKEERVEIANDIDPHMMISIHINAVDDSRVSGTEVWYYNKDSESDYGNITSKQLATKLVNKLVDALDTVNRGAKETNKHLIFTQTACPSVICEICFISNDAELERLKTKSFQEDAAEAIYEGVLEILGIM